VFEIIARRARENATALSASFAGVVGRVRVTPADLEGLIVKQVLPLVA